MAAGLWSDIAATTQTSERLNEIDDLLLEKWHVGQNLMIKISK